MNELVVIVVTDHTRLLIPDNIDNIVFQGDIVKQTDNKALMFLGDFKSLAVYFHFIAEAFNHRKVIERIVQ